MRSAVPASISSVRGVFDGKQSSTQDSSVGLENAGPAGARASSGARVPVAAGFMHAEVARPRSGGLFVYNMNTSKGKTTPLLRFESVAGTGRRRVPGVILSPDILPEHLPDEAGVDVRI